MNQVQKAIDALDAAIAQRTQVGDLVIAQRTHASKPFEAVVVENNGKAVAIARLRNDGTMYQERLWTGTYYSVAKK